MRRIAMVRKFCIVILTVLCFCLIQPATNHSFFPENLVKIISPQPRQEFTSHPVEILVKLHRRAKKETFRAYLNGRSITEKFEQVPGTKYQLRALVGPEDGLRVTLEGRIRTNRLWTSVRGPLGTLDIDYRKFYVIEDSEEVFSLLRSVSIDGGEGGDDQPRGIVVDESGHVYVAGYITAGGQRDIWLAKYDANLNYIDGITRPGPANGDDEGYTMALDNAGHLYVIGYMSIAGQGHDIWLAKFDTSLNFIKEITVNGTDSDDDEGYGIMYDEDGEYLFVAGYVRDTGQNGNIWIGKYDTDLNQEALTIRNYPANDTDKARFLAIDNSGNLFVSGSISQATTDYDLWIGKFDKATLAFIDEEILVGPTTEEDKGYGMIVDGTDIYITGTITESGQGFNIWLAKYDTDLNQLDSMTINGPLNGEDVAYTMIMDDSGRLYHTGVYSEVNGGANIWIAQFNKNLDLLASTTINGSADGYDTGLGIVRGLGQDFYVTGAIDETVGGFNIWIGHYQILQ